MFGWLKAKTSAQPPAPPRAPDGMRIFAIGDIHGRLDCLEDLLTRIKADCADYAGRKLVIGLGDYIDRGPSSKGVIERLMQPLGDGLDGIFLMGNHEQAFLRLFDDAAPGLGWLTYGGLQTLESYGITLTPGGFSDERVYEVQGKLHSAFPAAHRAWLSALPTHLTLGDYHFVHAGIKPKVPLETQNDNDRLWIRHEFLDFAGQLEKTIIHGHTISDEVEIRPHRIGIDTGAYASGRLTALVLESENRRIIQTNIT